jgi:hypothetical protein
MTATLDLTKEFGSLKQELCARQQIVRNELDLKLRSQPTQQKTIALEDASSWYALALVFFAKATKGAGFAEQDRT